LKFSRVKKIAATIRKAHSLVDWRQAASDELFTICCLRHVVNWTEVLPTYFKTIGYLKLPESVFATPFIFGVLDVLV